MTDANRPPLRVLMVEDYSQYYEGLGLPEKIATDEERSLPVIILTSKDTDANLLRKLMGWKVSMIHKDDRPSGDEVESAIRLVLRGYFVLSRLPAGDLPDLAAGAPGASTEMFSERDFAIFRLLSEEGCTNQQIAYRLGVKEDAVKKGVQRIFRRTGVASRAEAVRWWFEHKDELEDMKPE